MASHDQSSSTTVNISVTQRIVASESASETQPLLNAPQIHVHQGGRRVIHKYRPSQFQYSSITVPLRAPGLIAVDNEVIERFKRFNLRWKVILFAIQFLILPISPLYYFLRIRGLDDLPPTILYNLPTQSAILLLLIGGPLALFLSLQGWYFFRPPSSHSAPAPLPISSWQWIKLKSGCVDFNLLERTQWWCDHPCSMRQRAQFSVIAWIGWCTYEHFIGTIALIVGFELALAKQPVFPWGFIPFILFTTSTYMPTGFGYISDFILKRRPLEERDDLSGTAVLYVKVLNIDEALEHERKRFDLFGTFPQGTMYMLLEILFFLFLLG